MSAALNVLAVNVEKLIGLPVESNTCVRAVVFISVELPVMTYDKEVNVFIANGQCIGLTFPFLYFINSAEYMSHIFMGILNPLARPVLT